MNTSEQINEIAKAMSAAQSEMQNPAFDKKNPAFKSSYASLASCRKAIIPVFAKHGISIVQNIGSTDNGVTCSNLLMHTSGQWIQTDALEVPADRHNAHGYGSACTYARRFSLMALACVVGDEDDDGNQAAANPPSIMQVPLKESAKSVAQDHFDKMDEEEQAFLREQAQSIKDWFGSSEQGGFDAYREVTEKMDSEEKIALWSLLPSNIRTSIKKQGEKKAA